MDVPYWRHDSPSKQPKLIFFFATLSCIFNHLILIHLFSIVILFFILSVHVSSFRSYSLDFFLFIPVYHRYTVILFFPHTKNSVRNVINHIVNIVNFLHLLYVFVNFYICCMSEQFSLLYILRSIQCLCSIVGRVGNSPVMVQAWAGNPTWYNDSFEKFLAICHYCMKEKMM